MPAARVADNVVTCILPPGNEDPATVMERIEMEWAHETITSFNAVPTERFQAEADDLPDLPDLYLLDLHEKFRDGKHQTAEMSHLLRAGNANEELRIVLPADCLEPPHHLIEPGFVEDYNRTINFLKAVGEVPVKECTAKPGVFGAPPTGYTTTAASNEVSFPLRASRPKAAISLDKAAHGVPEDASIYLFLENHRSVAQMNEQDHEAIAAVIEALANDEREDAQELGRFFKIFYEGGFAYNKKEYETAETFAPVNCTIAVMSPEKRRDLPNQQPLSFDAPIVLPPQFLPFSDSVPVTIEGIRDMSKRHRRYGLFFTRTIHIWQGEAFSGENKLDYCALAPNGGFFYVPDNLTDFLEFGGILYPFGKGSQAKKGRYEMVG